MAALAVTLGLLYAMMGLWGLVTFLLGISTVVVIQFVFLFIYISYERKRAQNYSA